MIIVIRFIHKSRRAGDFVAVRRIRRHFRVIAFDNVIEQPIPVHVCRKNIPPSLNGNGICICRVVIYEVVFGRDIDLQTVVIPQYIVVNDEVVRGLASRSGERFAYDSYRRFLDMFGDVVCKLLHCLKFSSL